jgi:hypothetical protein
MAPPTPNPSIQRICHLSLDKQYRYAIMSLLCGAVPAVPTQAMCARRAFLSTAYRPIALNSELSACHRRSLSPFLATLTDTPQVAENPATLSLAFDTLTHYVTRKSFIRHSYTKLRGWVHHRSCPHLDSELTHRPSLIPVYPLFFLRVPNSFLAGAKAKGTLSPIRFVFSSFRRFPPVSRYLLSFHILPNSFATLRNLCSFFSCKSELLRQNTRGGYPSVQFIHSRRSRAPSRLVRSASQNAPKRHVLPWRLGVK